MNVAVVANAIQGIKAHALNDTGLMLDALPELERISVVSGVRRVLLAMAGGAIKSPSDLHDHNCSILMRDGWRFGPVYRPLKSKTPLLRPFHALPHDIRGLVTRCYDVLRAAVDASTEFAGRNAPTGNLTTNQS